jgi:hypothetical protein
MATKNIVPRAAGEGKLGTSSKKWLEINTVTGSFELLKASGLQDGSGNDLIVAGDNITVNKSSSGQFEISGSGGGLVDIVNDTSPQLGGILDLNSFDITGSGNINITGNLTVDGSVTTLSTTNLVVKDPVVLLASGSTSSNTEGGIAILSGSSVSNESLVFGRVANDTWGVGRKDVTGGTVTDLSDMTLVDFKAATINASIITASNGFSGSLTQLVDGSSYLIEGTGITIVSESNGAITISSSDAGSVAADDITIGNAAVNIGTTSGNTTINSANGQTTTISGSNVTLISENDVTVTGDLKPTAGNTHDLGATSAEWKDLYLSDSSVIYFGDNQDVSLVHDHNQGLILSMSDAGKNDPVFKLTSGNTDNGNGPGIVIEHDFSGSDRTSYMYFKNRNTVGGSHTQGSITVEPVSSVSNYETANMFFGIAASGSIAYFSPALVISGSTLHQNSSSIDIVRHDGISSGLKLSGELVTSTAAELNVLDGGTSATSTTVVDADRVVLNDDGTMVQVAMSDIKSYIGGGTTYSSQTGDFNAAAGYHYGVDTSSGIVTATLPSVSSNADSSIRFKIKAGSNALILEGDGSDTVDGFSSFIITDLSQSLSVMSDGGTNWEIF